MPNHAIAANQRRIACKLAASSVSKMFAYVWFLLAFPSHSAQAGSVFRRLALDILSGIPDPDSRPLQGYGLDHRQPTGGVARLGYNSSLPGEKTGHCSSELKSTFRHLSISRHAFFVTIGPKPSCNI